MPSAHQILVEHFRGPEDTDAGDLIWEHGDRIQALLLFPVFFPAFAEIDGHVVLESYLDEEGGSSRLQELLRSGERPLSEVLRGYRWREVPQQFRNLSDATEPVREVLE